MNILTLERRPYGSKTGPGQPVHAHEQTDYVVDGEALSARFGFEGQRPLFGQTCFEWSAEHLELRALELRGLAPARSQLGEGRFVLYGCHCGSDYCGVISCVITREGGEVIWRDVRFEDDLDEGEGGAFEGEEEELMYVLRLGELRFEAEGYDEEVARHASGVLEGAKA